jgi:hypothetical protein
LCDKVPEPAVKLICGKHLFKGDAIAEPMTGNLESQAVSAEAVVIEVAEKIDSGPYIADHESS